MARALRHGYTTGACAAAAAKGAALLLRGQGPVESVTIELPAGVSATFRLRGQRFEATAAACCVVKDAGDDPDVTHGCEVWAEVRLPPPDFGHPPLVKGGLGGVVIEGGVGIGRVSKPGLAVAVGEWAINPVPRRMIGAAIREIFPTGGVQVTISIPDGEERAKRTLNARLGILGGLSILGTTGIVKPISAQAWTDTLAAALDVAKACGCTTVVLSTGRTSELVAEGRLPELPDEAYIMMGDHVGYALRACAARGFGQIVLAGQFAKLLKIGCGHEQTHVASSDLDLRTLAGWLQREPSLHHLAQRAATANTAREVLETSGTDPALVALVAERARGFAATLAPARAIKVLLAGYGGEVLYFR